MHAALVKDSTGLVLADAGGAAGPHEELAAWHALKPETCSVYVVAAVEVVLSALWLLLACVIQHSAAAAVHLYSFSPQTVPAVHEAAARYQNHAYSDAAGVLGSAYGCRTNHRPWLKREGPAWQPVWRWRKVRWDCFHHLHPLGMSSNIGIVNGGSATFLLTSARHTVSVTVLPGLATSSSGFEP